MLTVTLQVTVSLLDPGAVIKPGEFIRHFELI